jgi:excisionase family DNA binding protein
MENPFELILERLDRIEKAINNLNPSDTINVEEKTMDIIELANYIKVAKTSIYGLTNQKKIPYYKLGKKLHFKKSEIDEWIFSKRIKTRDDIEKEAMEYISKNPRRF